MEQEGTKLADLPEELIASILQIVCPHFVQTPSLENVAETLDSRSEVEDLCNCMLVCKKWYSLLYTPTTIRLVKQSKKKILFFDARLAEQLERYREMAKFAEEACILGIPFTTEERNLLAVAFKNVLGLRRSPYRTLSSLMCKEENKPQDESTRFHLKLIKAKIDQLDQEYCETCQTAIRCFELLANVPETTKREKVFYYKSQADYCRARLENLREWDSRQQHMNEARAYYEKALSLAKAELAPFDAIALGTVLNFSVFAYEVLSDPNLAMKMSSESFSLAVSQLDQLDEDTYKDATLLLGLIRDNMALWSSDISDEEED